MPTDTHLAVTQDTKGRFESLKYALSAKYGEQYTHEKTVLWLMEHAPDPEDVDD